MKKLINYLGFNNVIISIVENGDSVDNTRKYLENFQNYLNNKNIFINLLSTNKEDFDSVCGRDIFSHYFYDRWVTIDLDGNGLKKYFTFLLIKKPKISFLIINQ